MSGEYPKDMLEGKAFVIIGGKRFSTITKEIGEMFYVVATKEGNLELHHVWKRKTDLKRIQ